MEVDQARSAISERKTGSHRGVLLLASCLFARVCLRSVRKGVVVDQRRAKEG